MMRVALSWVIGAKISAAVLNPGHGLEALKFSNNT